MIILFWILSIVFLSFFIYFIVNIIILRYNKIHKRWGLVLTENLIKEKILLKDSEGNIINCYLYTSTDFKNYDKMPGVIILPRRDKKYPYWENLGAHFALQGYPSICLEVYDKKLSRQAFVEKYTKILPIVKEKLISDSRVDAKKLVYFGIGFAAEVVLLKGLHDNDVKAICGISMPLIDESKVNQWKNSDKVYLVHCQDDKNVPFSDFEKNCENFGLKKGDFLYFELGGHNLLSQEPIAAAFFSIKIKQKLKPVYKQIVRREI